MTEKEWEDLAAAASWGRNDVPNALELVAKAKAEIDALRGVVAAAHRLDPVKSGDDRFEVRSERTEALRTAVLFVGRVAHMHEKSDG